MDYIRASNDDQFVYRPSFQVAESLPIKREEINLTESAYQALQATLLFPAIALVFGEVNLHKDRTSRYKENIN